MDQFILFGDSLTQQAFSADHGVFGSALSDAYVRRLDIVNRGFSGYNTFQALQVLPKVMPAPAQARVRFMTIFFGANDSRLPNTPFGPQQHVPLQQFKNNIRAMATHPCVRAHQDIRIILITPPPVDERKLMQADQEAFGQPTIRRTAAATADYAAGVRVVGSELGLAVLDLWTATMQRSGWRRSSDSAAVPLPGAVDAPLCDVLQGFSRDGLHFSRIGYHILFDELMNLIERTWPDQMPDKLPFVFPPWDNEAAWNSANETSSVRHETPLL